MTGHVIVDDLDSEESGPWRPSSAWLVGLTAVVLVTLVLLPGSRRAEVVPTTVTLPQVAVAEDRWTRLDLPGIGPLTDVAATDSGAHVAVGFGPQFWWSTDGLDWKWATGDVDGPGRVAAVEPLAEGAVAVGALGVDATTGVATVWVTADGSAWEKAALVAPSPSGLEDVRSTDHGLVAWGWQGDPGIFDPGTDSLLLTSPDGARWETVPPPREGARIVTVDWTGGRWLAGGIDAGRPAAWSSPDLRSWDRIPTDGMPFGWVMTEIGLDEEALVAEITDSGSGRVWRWVRGADGTWQNDDLTGSGPTAFIDGDAGVGSGQLWAKEDDEWVPIDIEGSVEAIAGSVAVGEADFQPTLWLRDVPAEPTAEVAAAGDGRWQVIDDLGEGALGGAWPVGDGWLVGVSRQWWLVDDRGVEPVATVDNPPARVVGVGDEWVALPSLNWGTADGRAWEQRSEPWAGALEGSQGATVRAAAVIDGALRVVGTDADWNWVVAESRDGGRSWQALGEPAFPTPIWDIAGIPAGFAATVARRGASREVIVSEDGLEWESAVVGDPILTANVPAVTTESGTLLLLDTGEEVEPPPGSPVAISRHREDLMVVSGRSLWLGPGDWEEVPLDPPHGMSARDIYPLSVEGRLLAVGSDRGRVRFYEWEP